MKKLLLGLALVASIPALANNKCPNIQGQYFCDKDTASQEYGFIEKITIKQEGDKFEISGNGGVSDFRGIHKTTANNKKNKLRLDSGYSYEVSSCKDGELFKFKKQKGQRGLSKDKRTLTINKINSQEIEVLIEVKDSGVANMIGGLFPHSGGALDEKATMFCYKI